MFLHEWFRSRQANTRPADRRRSRLAVEVLETREVPAVSLGSAVGAGNDTGSTSSKDVAVDAAGNSYLTGSFSGTVDFDPANDRLGGTDVVTARGSFDAFVAKYAADGSLAWAVRMGGDSLQDYNSDSGDAVAVDSAGNVYVTGKFLETADFGPYTRMAAGSDDGFVTKLNPNGAVQWVSRWGGSLSDWGRGIGVDSSGNVYVAGSRNDNEGGNQHGVDILKLNSSGASMWSKWVNTHYLNSLRDLAVSPNGNVYAAGTYYGSVDFDPGAKTQYRSSGTSYGAFVLNLSSTGDYRWVSPFIGRAGTSTHGYSMATALTLDGTGNVIVAGVYGGPVDFNPGSGTTLLPTVGGGFVTKLNSNGALAWTKALERDPVIGGGATIYSLATDVSGNVYATGSLQGAVDFDPSSGSALRRSVRRAGDQADSSDVFVLRLTAAGNYGWVETFGSSGDDIGFGVAVDPSGVIHTTGHFVGTVDFDPDPMTTDLRSTPGTFRNLFLVRLRQS